MINWGSSGNLRSIPLLHTAPAWTSIATGRNPGKHGIPYFTLREDNSYNMRFVSSRDIACKRYWDYLSENGYRVGVINFPVTYPPAKINGVMVTSLLTFKKKNYVYPKKFQKKLDRFNYKIIANCYDRKKESLKDLYKTTEARIKAVNWFMKNYKWDQFTLVFYETEQLHHFYASFLDSDHPEYNPKYESIVRNYYKKIDEFLGRLIAKNINIFVVSDHGFCASRKTLFLNNFLDQLGYYKKKTESISKKILRRSRNYFKILPHSIQSFAKKMLPRNALSMVTERIQSVNADWSKTLMYCPYHLPVIYINKIGRESKGIVDEKEIDTIIKKIKEDILNSTLGEYFINVERKEKYFSGPLIERLPDIILIPKSCLEIAPDVYTDDIWKPCTNKIGSHTFDGVFIAYGPDISKANVNAHIYDIAPTVLHMFNIPVPKDMDGKILKEIFK